jgi:hypothetical protein
VVSLKVVEHVYCGLEVRVPPSALPRADTLELAVVMVVHDREGHGGCEGRFGTTEAATFCVVIG